MADQRSPLKAFNSLGQPIIYASSSGSASSSSEESSGETIHERNLQYMRTQQWGNNTQVDQRVKGVLDTMFPQKMPTSAQQPPPLTPLKAGATLSLSSCPFGCHTERCTHRRKQRPDYTELAMPTLTRNPVQGFSSTATKGISVALPTSKVPWRTVVPAE